MISREELPSYSTERFFMLSEFHLTAHSIKYISQIQDVDEKRTPPEAVDTSATPSVEVLPHESTTDSFPPYLLFYVLWGPDMTTSVTDFTDEIITKAVEQLQSHHVEIALSDENKKRTRDVPKSPSKTSLNESDAQDTSREQESVSENASLDSEDSGKTRLYLVVDRIVPYHSKTNTKTKAKQDDSNTKIDKDEAEARKKEEREIQQRQFEVEVDLAERLARHIASHPKLRSLFHGITVGVANHKRAAPGLEACMDVVNLGAADRRKFGRDTRSHVGIVTMSDEDLLGLDEEGEADAAQDILQTRISMEWNGRGNLQSFAFRAHAMWRHDFGLPPQPSDDYALTPNKRRIPRRASQQGELKAFGFIPLDLLLNIGAFLLMAYYVWKGVVGENGMAADENEL